MNIPRSAPRWFHIGAILTLGIVLFPLVLGQLVTSLRAGMADPKWPTEPWYLIENYKLDIGYLVEHSHRIAGFALGGVISLLTIGLWFTEPRKFARWVGVGGIVVLLVAFGEFHRAMLALGETSEVIIPLPPVVGMGFGFGLALLVGVSGMFTRVRGAGFRTLTLFTLVAVMIQGLLGGTRVLYNALSGPQLATTHGVFAQIVFSLLVAMAVLSAKRPPGGMPTRRVRRVAVLLVALLLVQLVWGAFVRHLPTALMQRLHFLTAFVILAGVMILSRGLKADAVARARAKWLGIAMGVLVTFQILLGVEAWMGKFGSFVRPEMEKITDAKAAIRTAHVLIGTLLLGSVVGIAVRLRMKPSGSDEPEAGANRYNNHETMRERVAVAHAEGVSR